MGDISNFILKFTLHSATIKIYREPVGSAAIRAFTLQKQESIQSIDNIRFLDVFCVLTVHYSNRQI